MIFCDIDGTCANLSHRLPYIQGTQKNWAKFLDPAIVALDTPMEGTRVLLKILADMQDIVYVSGRPESLRKTTIDWLRKHDFPVSTLLMRPDGDFRADYLIKEEMLKDVREPPAFVIDDRPQVCDMWRRHGIPVIQLP